MLRRWSDHDLVKAAALAAAYAVGGRLSLLLAIPPGYATAVWPPAGIALAGILLGGWRLWPGLWLGSFLVNVSTSWDSSSVLAVLQSLALAGGIAAGAVLQAVTGAWLIRRFVGYSNIFTQEVDAVRILLLGGPLSCIINASVGVTSLWLAGLVPALNLLFNWWTWWIGDSIGVLIFVPLICAWALRPIGLWLRNQIALTVPLVAMFVVVVILFFFVSSREQARLQSEFERTAQRLTQQFQGRLSNDLVVLDSIKSFFSASEQVTRDQFRLFVSNQVHAHSDLKALEWVPRVTREQRAAFDLELRSSGISDRGIWQRNARGEAVPATDRPDYFPVDYFEPRQGNVSAVGYDEYPGQARRGALEAALATGRPTATSRVRLVQETGDEWGTLVVAPVFLGAMDYPTREERAAHLLGYAEIVIRNGDFARAAFGDLDGTGLRLRLLDSTQPDRPELLYESGVPGAFKPAQIAMARTVPVTVAERRWTLEFLLPADYLVAHRSWQAWGLLAVGLLITGLLGMLILVLIARQAKVEELVLARTADLRSAEQKLAGYARELERSNAELEQFAYVASHDLQAPLRSIVGFGQILEKDYRGRLDADADTYIQFMVNSSLQMQALIRDLLSFSRIGRERAADGLADCEQVLAEVEQRLQGLIREHRAVISHDPLPTVQCAPLELGQVLQNLIGNAIKFQVPGRQPLVHIGAQREGGQWRLWVRDNGIGIDARYHERIFQMFQRLHTADKYEGTGIGLAICRKIVQRHGGRLWVESEPGKGSVFYFTLGAAGPS